ncbi:MAG: hypothetical protein JO080_09225 [Mucilaginibacter sp.]|nr:hypothetical protein [Mucilaginibacter sp.]
MLKRLLFSSLCLLFFIPVFAQTHEDSVKNQPIADTTSKRQLTDSIVKRVVVDSAARHQPTDSVQHNKVDSMAKIHPVDSVVKHAAVDSTSVIHKPAIKAKKKSSLKAVTKPQAVADPELKRSTVKTISDLRYNAYLKGDDLDDMALAGDLNHFPSPDNVLKYKKQLDLSPIQVGQLTKLSNDLHRKKIEMGSNIIRNEKMIDSLFHLHQIDEGSLIFYTNRSGLYYGEMKGAILMACYNAEKLLTPAQIKKLEALEKTSELVK